MAAVEASRKLLDKFVVQETAIARKSEAKNRLESTVYMVNDKLADETLCLYWNAFDKANLTELATENDDWLYSYPADLADYKEFDKRSDEMKKYVDAAEKRRNLHKVRQESIDDMVRKIENTMIKVRQHRERNDWIEQAEVNKVNELVEQTVTNISYDAEKQDKAPLFEDPFLTQEYLDAKYRKINNALRKFKNLKKPEPVANATETITANATESTSDNSTEEVK